MKFLFNVINPQKGMGVDYTFIIEAEDVEEAYDKAKDDVSNMYDYSVGVTLSSVNQKVIENFELEVKRLNEVLEQAPEFDPERSTGRSTRIIDETIQRLFKSFSRSGDPEWVPVYDHNDNDDEFVWINLVSRINDRLKAEHGLHIEYNFNTHSIRIKNK